MSTDLNIEYQEVKFGEIAKHISKRVEPSETTLEIYVGLEHLDPDSLKITRHGVPSDVAGQKLLVKKGQIIFGKRRAYQRKVAVADWDCICSAHAMVLEGIPGKILPEFLPFFMQSNQFMDRAVEISEGSLSPTIKWKVLENQIFQLPNIAQQAKILEMVKKIDAVEYFALRSIDAIEDMEKSLEFSDYEDLCSGRLEDYLDKCFGGGTPSKAVKAYWENGNIPWVTVKDFKDDYISTAEDLITTKGLENSSSKLVDENVVLLAARMAVGKVGLTTRKCAINQDVKALIPKDSLDTEFLFYWLRKNRPKLESLGVGSTVKGIQVKDIMDLSIVFPKDIKDQKKYVNRLKALDKCKRKLNQKIYDVKNIKNALLSFK